VGRRITTPPHTKSSTAFRRTTLPRKARARKAKEANASEEIFSLLTLIQSHLTRSGGL
jgi:hypothetical protein